MFLSKNKSCAVEYILGLYCSYLKEAIALIELSIIYSQQVQEIRNTLK